MLNGFMNTALRLMASRFEPLDKVNYDDTHTELMGAALQVRGGYPQQNRMIKDKLKSLDRAVLYSYQGAWIKKVGNDQEVRALINPNKLKQDYDDKILSVRFDYNFQPGDVFDWCNTNSKWLIYLQDLTELAYFRAEIRKCSYELEWEDEDGRHSTYIALRGPVETKIDYVQKHSISVDRPNYSLNFLLPKNEETLKYFRRYSKFYLKEPYNDETNTCWRIEAVDAYSMPGIIEINAVEYYANTTEDDVVNGIVGALKPTPVDPNPEVDFQIIGEVFIKPKKTYTYCIDGEFEGAWRFDNKLPIKTKEYKDEGGRNCIDIKWDSSYSGQFDLYYQMNPEFELKKTIVVESLF